MRAQQCQFVRHASAALAVVVLSAAITSCAGSSPHARVAPRADLLRHLDHRAAADLALGALIADPGAAQSVGCGPVPVSGRASAPTDIRAPGLDITGGSLQMDVGTRPLAISADDWNTIVGTSKVPVDVGVIVDPRYNPSDVTRNRFQYLADKISLCGLSYFRLLGITGNAAGRHFTSTVAIYNATSQVVRLSHLSMQIIAQPPAVTVASKVFYTATHGGCIIPANTMFFAFLQFPNFTPIPKTATVFHFDFSFPAASICPKQICQTGLPISLCPQ